MNIEKSITKFILQDFQKFKLAKLKTQNKAKHPALLLQNLPQSLMKFSDKDFAVP